MSTIPMSGAVMARLAEGEVLDLDDVEGWIRLVNLCDATPFKTVVINTPAQSNVAVGKHASASCLTPCAEFSRPLITLWVINRQRDSPGAAQGLHGPIVYRRRSPRRLQRLLRRRKEVRALSDQRHPRPVTGQAAKPSSCPTSPTASPTSSTPSASPSLRPRSQIKSATATELARWRAAVSEMFTHIGV